MLTLHFIPLGKGTGLKEANFSRARIPFALSIGMGYGFYLSLCPEVYCDTLIYPRNNSVRYFEEAAPVNLHLNSNLDVLGFNPAL